MSVSGRLTALTVPPARGTVTSGVGQASMLSIGWHAPVRTLVSPQPWRRGELMAKVIATAVAFITRFLDVLLWALSLAIIGRAVLSWVDPAGRHPITRFLFDLSEPVVAPVRRVLPSTGAVDFSPLVALMLIWLVQRVLMMFAFS